jgi:hypothetical protein
MGQNVENFAGVDDATGLEVLTRIVKVDCARIETD